MEYIKSENISGLGFNEIEVKMVDAFTITKVELDRKEKELKKELKKEKVNNNFKNFKQKCFEKFKILNINQISKKTKQDKTNKINKVNKINTGKTFKIRTSIINVIKKNKLITFSIMLLIILFSINITIISEFFDILHKM